MARPGRKPKPTLLHELHGTLNATRHAKRATEVEAPGDELVEPPDWLTDSQKDGWRYAIRHAPRNLLKPIDRTMLAIWVEAEDRHRRAAMAQAALDARSPTFPLLVPRRGRGGDLVESPYLRVLSRAADTLLRAVSELGFSPASRPRIGAASEKAPDDDAASPWARLKVLQGGKSTSAA